MVVSELWTSGSDVDWKKDVEQHPVLQWVGEGNGQPWGEVAPFSPVTKGLWDKFACLRVAEGFLQTRWKKPETGEITWQVVVPKGLQGKVLQQLHWGVGAGYFGVSKTLKTCSTRLPLGQAQERCVGVL